LRKIAAAVPIDGLRNEDVGEYAGRCFDYLAANLELLRLLQWEALAYGKDEVPDEEGRTAHNREKVDAFAVMRNGRASDGQPDAAHLFALVLAVAQWWFAVPQVARMITGSTGHTRDEHDHRRATVVEAARRLTNTTTDC